MNSLKRSFILSLSLPIAYTEAKNKKKENAIYIKPSEISVYTGIDDLYEIDYHEHKRCALEERVSTVRQGVQDVLKTAMVYQDKAVHIYETGKAHSQTSLDYLLDENNVTARYGFIAAGGLAGILVAVRKGFIKKIFYSSIGLAGTSSIIYPTRASEISAELITNAKLYGVVGYNFFAGVKPSFKSLITDNEKEVIPSKEHEETAATENEAPQYVPIEEIISNSATETSENIPKNAPVEVDIGQSNLEDSDMYSTRG